MRETATKLEASTPHATERDVRHQGYRLGHVLSETWSVASRLLRGLPSLRNLELNVCALLASKLHFFAWWLEALALKPGR